MLAFVAQIISAVSYGNEYLRHGGRQAEIGALSVGKGDNGLVFFDCCSDKERKLVASGFDGWFAYLKKSGCKKMRLFYNLTDEPNTGGPLIDKSVQWVVETVFDETADYWISEWSYPNGFWTGKPTDGWKVEYLRTACNQPIVDRRGDLEEARQGLDEKLATLSAFASKLGDRERELRASGFSGDSFWEAAKKLEGYDGAQVWYNNAKHFDKLKALLYENPPDIQRGLIAAKNYSSSARQLFHAAAESWCFNGMGSWSDNCVNPYDEALHEEKEALTRDLFSAVCDAYVFVVNSY